MGHINQCGDDMTAITQRERRMHLNRERRQSEITVDNASKITPRIKNA